MRVELQNQASGATGSFEVAGETVTLTLPPFPPLTIAATQAAAIADAVAVIRKPFEEPAHETP